jgi:serine/arginine repetitive matrix protein 2
MEQDQHPSPSRAEQRMQAVLKLKRAASLPRMKDGRRPPMHVEAVSEGEKGGSDDDKKSDSSPPDVAVEPPVEVEMEVEVEIEMEATMDEGERTMSPGPAPRSKRRSRSRSRSRSSKDFKGKFRGTQSPTSSPFVNGDSSPDEEPPIPQPINIAEVAPLLSPIPSHFAELQRSRLLLRSPTPMSPEPQFYPGSSPSTPLLPSLEALQRGLFRSNSASGSHTAGRMMAMHKLTGGTEVYDPSTSPAPAPLPGKLSRNNTVSGGERVAARQFMLSRLGGRFTKDADGDQVSGGDDIPSPSPTPKRKRRRSRRGSTTANAGVSDSEFLSTTPSTPIATPLPITFDGLAELRAGSTTPYGAANPPISDIEKVPEFPPTEELVPDVAGEEKTEHPRRRSVVVEDDDEERYPPVRMYAGLPSPTAQRSSPVPIAFHVGHASDVPSNGSVDSASPSAISVPLYLSQRAPSRLGSFPSSPFTTPLKEMFQRDDDEEEQVVYHADSYRSRTPYDERFEREISWIADPGMFLCNVTGC